MNNKLPPFITLISNEIINKKNCMQMYGHTILDIRSKIISKFKILLVELISSNRFVINDY